MIYFFQATSYKNLALKKNDRNILFATFFPIQIMDHRSYIIHAYICFMLHHALYVDQTTNKGRGVFATETIVATTIIEISPVIVMSMDDRVLLDKTLLHDYIFEWGEHKDQCCMALGFIPIYNHSYKSNCEYFMDYANSTILVKTVRDIEKGEELTINYNGDWDDGKKIWFDAK